MTTSYPALASRTSILQRRCKTWQFCGMLFLDKQQRYGYVGKYGLTIAIGSATATTATTTTAKYDMITAVYYSVDKRNAYTCVHACVTNSRGNGGSNSSTNSICNINSK